MARTEVQDCDRDEIAEFIVQHWHSKVVVSRGRSYYPHLEQGFIERRDGKLIALLTYRCGEDGVEVLTLNSTISGQGIGTGLMLASIEKAREQNHAKIWLTTTNDNLRAVGFYQRLGFRLVKVNLGAVNEARKTKPEIPEIGERGIPIHDEFVMELLLKPYLDE